MTDRPSDGLVHSTITPHHLLAGAAAWSVAAVTSTNAAAQAYPNQNIALIVPFTPGGSTDILARLLGQRLETALKYPIVVKSRPGAGGSVGMASVACAAPEIAESGCPWKEKVWTNTPDDFRDHIAKEMVR